MNICTREEITNFLYTFFLSYYYSIILIPLNEPKKKYFDIIINMNELLETYNLDNTFISIQDRNEFYTEAKKQFIEHGLIYKKVKLELSIVNLYLLMLADKSS